MFVKRDIHSLSCVVSISFARRGFILIWGFFYNLLWGLRLSRYNIKIPYDSTAQLIQHHLWFVALYPRTFTTPHFVRAKRSGWLGLAAFLSNFATHETLVSATPYIRALYATLADDNYVKQTTQLTAEFDFVREVALQQSERVNNS